MACRPILPGMLLLALVTLGRPASVRAAPSSAGAPATTTTEPPAHSEVDAARAELASLATRIEALKKEVAAGRAGRTELQPLLARAQELAAKIERLSPPQAVPSAPPSVPDAQELRERADALRDRADRLERAMSQVDARVGELRRRSRLEQNLQNVGGAGDVLADAAPRGVPSSRTGGGAAMAQAGSNTSSGGVPTATPGTPPGPTTSTPPPSTGGQPSTPAVAAGPPPSVDAASRALSVPPGREVDPLLPTAGDSLQDLLRKRARLHGEASTLRSRAEALDAEAVRTENVR